MVLWTCAQDGEEWTEVARTCAHGDRPAYTVSSAAQGGVFLTGGGDDAVCGWRFEDLAQTFRADCAHAADVNCIDVADNGGVVVATAGDDGVHVWQLELS